MLRIPLPLPEVSEDIRLILVTVEDLKKKYVREVAPSQTSSLVLKCHAKSADDVAVKIVLVRTDDEEQLAFDGNLGSLLKQLKMQEGPVETVPADNIQETESEDGSVTASVTPASSGFEDLITEGGDAGGGADPATGGDPGGAGS